MPNSTPSPSPPARRRAAGVVLAGVVAAVPVLAARASAQAATPLALHPVADGLEKPVFATATRDEPGRVFVAEQATGHVKVVRDGVVLPDPFLDIGHLLDPDSGILGEQGLLGLAFHPDYPGNGRFYVGYTDDRGDTVVAEYRRDASDPDLADPASAREILFVEQPMKRHNNGMLAFGPHDRLLYIGLGDGGFDWDDDPSLPPEGNAQSLGELLGKIVRLDPLLPPPFVPASNPFVGVSGARPEIWALGLRNPWRFSFDRDTGDLWLTDVGYFTEEEVDRLPAGHGGGANFGWRCMEASTCTGHGGCLCGGSRLTMPVHVVPHLGGHCAIIGGYVYRGLAIPDLRGAYLFGDLCSNKIWSLRYDTAAGAVTDVRELTPELQPDNGSYVDAVVSFGEDAAGELLVVDYWGEVFRLVPDVPLVGLGSGLPGAAGEPVLFGDADLGFGSPGSLYLRDARPNATALMLVSLSSTAQPFYGGTLLASPPLPLDLVFGTDAEGSLDLHWGAWPIDMPGLPFVMQFAVADPAAVAGVSLSNALAATNQ